MPRKEFKPKGLIKKKLPKIPKNATPEEKKRIIAERNRLQRESERALRRYSYAPLLLRPTGHKNLDEAHRKRFKLLGEEFSSVMSTIPYIVTPEFTVGKGAPMVAKVLARTVTPMTNSAVSQLMSPTQEISIPKVLGAGLVSAAPTLKNLSFRGLINPAAIAMPLKLVAYDPYVQKRDEFSVLHPEESNPYTYGYLGDQMVLKFPEAFLNTIFNRNPFTSLATTVGKTTVNAISDDSDSISSDTIGNGKK